MYKWRSRLPNLSRSLIKAMMVNQFGIVEVDAVKQLGLPAISHLIRAGQEGACDPGKCSRPRQGRRHAKIHRGLLVPNVIAHPPRERKSSDRRSSPRPCPARSISQRAHDPSAGQIILERFVPPPADQSRIIRKHLRNKGWRQAPLQTTNVGRRVRKRFPAHGLSLFFNLQLTQASGTLALLEYLQNIQLVK